MDVKKHRIGTQDVMWDVTGTGVVEYVETSTGSTRAVERVNASHLPTTEDLRDAFDGAIDVDASLDELATVLGSAIEAGGTGESMLKGSPAHGGDRPAFCWYEGTPHLNVTAPYGSLCVDVANGVLYINQSSPSGNSWSAV